MRRWLCLLLPLFCCWLGVGHAGDLRVGINPARLPLEFTTERGVASGALVDLWRLWGEGEGRAVVFVSGDDQSLAALLQSGRIDVLANAPPGLPLAYSAPYYSHDYYLFSKRNRPIESLDLPPKVGIFAPDQQMLQGVVLEKLRPQVYPDGQALMADLLSGTIDFAMANDIAINHAVYNVDLLRLNYPDAPCYSYPVRAAVLTQNMALLQSIDREMPALPPEKVDALRNRWSPSTIGYHLPWTMIGLAGLVLVVATLVVAVWLVNVRLAQQVEIQTRELSTQKKALEEDIERRKLLEQELLAARKAADRANAAKSEFLARMTHELRTPLIGLLGMNELLQQTELTAPQQAMATTMCRSGETLLSLVNNVLDFSRIESHKVTLQLEPVVLARLVEETVRLLEVPAVDKGLTLSCLATPAAASASVTVDPLRLRQILLNLVGNAIKYTERGGVDVHLDMPSGEAGQGHFMIEVRDTGIGIRDEDRERIFSPFVQMDNFATRVAEGVGLGLSIVRHLVELMGGTLEVESRPGVGSTFRVRLDLPLVARPADAAVPGAAGSEGVGPGAAAGPVRRILVADDYAVSRELVRAFLKKEPLVIDEAVSGQDVLDLAGRADYALFLLDCNMPLLNGMEVARQLRERGVLAPIVAFTAHVDRRILEECRSAGMDDCLPKPFRRNDLRAMLRKWLPATAGGEERNIPGGTDS